MTTTMKVEDNRGHDGMKVKRIRELLRVKQISLAHALGEDWNQKKVSYLEDKEEIDDKLMQEIANALKVPVEAIKNFDEESTVMNIQNNYEGSNPNSNNSVSQNIETFNFNPMEKLMEVIDENKKLYERLVQSEKEKVESLQQIINKQ